jgi:hypothetical protein
VNLKADGDGDDPSKAKMGLGANNKNFVSPDEIRIIIDDDKQEESATEAEAVQRGSMPNPALNQSTSGTGL